MISILNPQIEPSRRLTISFVRSFSWALLVMGGVTLVYAIYVVSDTAVFQHAELQKLESSGVVSKNNFVTRGMTSSERPVVGEIIGEIQVPRLGLKAIVMEGDSARILRRSVGHIPNTVLPGETGNAVLAGHRDSLFRPLRKIQKGDLVTFNLRGYEFHYEVFSIEVVSPEDVAVLRPTSGRQLTLITCFPFGFIGPAPSRLVVRAREIEKPSTQTQS